MRSIGSRIARSLVILMTAGVSTLNGLPDSPLFDPVLFHFSPRLGPLAKDPMAPFYLNMLFISMMTMALAGIPAAVYERARGASESTPLSLGLWLVTALLLATPGILGAAGYFSID